MTEERVVDLPIFDNHDPDQPPPKDGPPADSPARLLPVDHSRTPARPRRSNGHTPDPIDITAPDSGPLDRSALGFRRSPPPVDDIDWALVTAYRVETSTRLAEWSKLHSGHTPENHQEQGRIIIAELLDEAARTAMAEGRSLGDVREQERMAGAVYDAVFRLGRLQPMIDDERIENIEIRGHNRVQAQYLDGSREQRPAVADSDAELVDFIGFLAERSTVNSRPFSPAHPILDLQLDGGARLAASYWINPYPLVTIRRDRLKYVRLKDLESRGLQSSTLSSFLSAAVKAKLSPVVSGAQGAGKTTLVRALCNEIPMHETIGTFETEFELRLHEIPERAGMIHPFEARPGSGEPGPNGRRAGEVTISDCLRSSFRHNEDRQIVGEIRGWEVLDMIKAMQSGSGSLSTTHAKNARGAISKLVTCALEAGPHVTETYAKRAIAESIDLVVHITMDTRLRPDGEWERTRYISEVVAVEWSGEGPSGVSFTDIFITENGQTRPHVLPDHLRYLEQFGFDLEGFYAAGGALTERERP